MICRHVKFITNISVTPCIYISVCIYNTLYINVECTYTNSNIMIFLWYSKKLITTIFPIYNLERNLLPTCIENRNHLCTTLHSHLGIYVSNAICDESILEKVFFRSLGHIQSNANATQITAITVPPGIQMIDGIKQMCAFIHWRHCNNLKPRWKLELRMKVKRELWSKMDGKGEKI